MKLAPLATDLLHRADSLDDNRGDTYKLAKDALDALDDTPENALTRSYLTVVVALSFLRFEPANIASAGLLKHQRTVLYNLDQPHAAVLVRWYHAMALLLRQWRAGEIPEMDVRTLRHIQQRFMLVGKTAQEHGDVVHARLGLSMAAELSAHLGDYGTARRLIEKFNSLSTDRDTDQRLLLRRAVHTNIQVVLDDPAMEPANLPRDYAIYLVEPGELLAAFQADNPDTNGPTP